MSLDNIWIRWLMHAALRKRWHGKYTNIVMHVCRSTSSLGKCHEKLMQKVWALNVILNLVYDVFWKNNYRYNIIEMIFQDRGSRTCHCSQYSKKIPHIQHKRYVIYNQRAWMNFSACHYTAKLVTISKKECIFFHAIRFTFNGRRRDKIICKHLTKNTF